MEYKLVAIKLSITEYNIKVKEQRNNQIKQRMDVGEEIMLAGWISLSTCRGPCWRIMVVLNRMVCIGQIVNGRSRGKSYDSIVYDKNSDLVEGKILYKEIVSQQ